MISSALAVLESDEQRNMLAEFYEENKNRFFHIALSKLHNYEAAEDAVQEMLLRIVDKPEKFFALDNLRKISYACAVLRNISVNLFNNGAKIKEYLSDDNYKDEFFILDDSLFDNISCNEIVSYIDNLPELQRDVLIMTCLVGATISETAEALRISVRAVNQRLYLARKSLKSFIDERNKCNE